MSEQATTSHGIPTWVWIAGGAVILIALLAHNSSSAGGAASTLIPTSTATSADNTLATAQLTAQTSIAEQLLNIAGSEDIAQIQAGANQSNNAYTLAAVQTEATGTVVNPPQPPITVVQSPPPIVTTPSTTTTPAQSAAMSVAQSNVQQATSLSLNNIAGAVSDGVHYAAHLTGL